jgi:hypothetical protein
MARKWEISLNQYAWNFERCEELVLIAGYEEIKAFIPPGLTWPEEFENHFYQHGNGVAFRFIDEINSVRRRRVMPRLEFKETDVLEYGRSTNKLMKSEHRRRVREEVNAASFDVRLRMVTQASEEMKGLLPPHITYEEYKSNRRRFQNESDLSREEVGRRVRARQLSDAPAPRPQPSLNPDKALTMLKYASSPELRSKIIDSLSPDDALAAVGQVEDAELRDALILHSFTKWQGGSRPG